MSALLFLLPCKHLVANTAKITTDFLFLQRMERQKYWESKLRSRQDEPFIITIGAKWKCSNVCSWGILTDREIWTLFLYYDLICFYQAVTYFHRSVVWQHQLKSSNSGRYTMMYLPELKPHNHYTICFSLILSSFMGWYSGVLGVEEPHQSIPNLVVKLYCGDNTVGEALRKNSSTPGWKKFNNSYSFSKVVSFKTAYIHKIHK